MFAPLRPYRGPCWKRLWARMFRHYTSRKWNDMGYVDEKPCETKT